MARPLAPTSFARQPLDLILGGPASVRILRTLFEHGDALAVSRIAKESRVTANGARNTLRHLENTGIVERLGSARSILYRGVRIHPLAGALVALFEIERYRWNAVLDSIRRVCDIPEMAALWLFGSAARGEDALGSDIDVAIILEAEPGTIDSIADRIRDALAHEAARLVFSVSVIALSTSDVDRLAHEQSPFWRGLLRDAQTLAGPPPNRQGWSNVAMSRQSAIA